MQEFNNEFWEKLDELVNISEIIICLNCKITAVWLFFL